MLQTLSQFTIPLTIATATIVIFIGQFLNGRSKLRAEDQSVSSEVIKAYAEQVKLLREKQIEDKNSYDKTIDGFRKEISDLTLKIGEQNGVIGEKDKLLNQYKEIFQNRNPELLEVLKEIREFMAELHSKVTIIEERSEKREKRDKAVDEGHAHASGV